MNEDGSMARLPELLILAEKYGMKIVSIEDLIKYRLEKESLIERMVSVHMPTTFGDFDLIAYRHIETGQEHLALRSGQRMNLSWSECILPVLPAIFLVPAAVIALPVAQGDGDDREGRERCYFIYESRG